MFVEVLPFWEGSEVLMSVGLILAFPCIDLSRDCSVSRVSVYPVFAYDFVVGFLSHMHFFVLLEVLAFLSRGRGLMPLCVRGVLAFPTISCY